MNDAHNFATDKSVETRNGGNLLIGNKSIIMRDLLNIGLEK